tara:strand:+ start:187 stop:516 length:330 start_codon:yes stop_codon:yes gene_type:complete
MNVPMAVGISAIRRVVGKKVFNSLLKTKKQKPFEKLGYRPISDEKLDIIISIIKKYTNATRGSVIAESGFSKSTVDNGVKALGLQERITTEIKFPLGVRTGIYSMREVA